jgi:hypothetical protein
MNTNTSSKQIRFNRRRFLSATVMSVAAAQLGLIGSARADSKKAGGPDRSKTGTNASFASLKQIDAGLLNVGRWPQLNESADNRSISIGRTSGSLTGWFRSAHAFAVETGAIEAANDK